MSRNEDRSTAGNHRPLAPWQRWLHTVIFEADTPGGKAFDVGLLVAIVLSVVVVMLESVGGVRERWGAYLTGIEWTLTILFTIEYILRLACVASPWRYATSFFGWVDLVAVLPTYFSLVFAGAQSLIVVRAFRLIRVFRVFKLSRYIAETQALLIAMRRTSRKITVFLVVVLALVLVMGSAMYLIEGPENGFTSIPVSVYWAVVTMTTVGYGDIAPKTVPGQALAAVAMIVGYSIIVVPTGIFSAEIASASSRREVTTQACPFCQAEGHDRDAVYCKLCGGRL